MAELGQISNVYNDQPYQDFATLSRGQSVQSLFAGDQAARYSDPYAEQRKRDIESLRLLTSNPGSIETSPFYKFLMDQQLNAVQSRNAATGNFRSGRGAMALQDRAAGVASQAYFPLLNNLTTRAISGSSPTAAGVTYERAVGRSQDQAQMAAAARAAGQQRPPQAPQVPAMTAPTPPAAQSYAPTSGGFGLPYGGYSGAFNDPLRAGYIDTASGPMAYTPTENSGTGYVMSDYGVQELNGPGSQYYSFGGGGQSQPEQPQPSYASSYPSDNYDYSSFGGGDSLYG